MTTSVESSGPGHTIVADVAHDQLMRVAGGLTR